jgi:hypothetical protein
MENTVNLGRLRHTKSSQITQKEYMRTWRLRKDTQN